MSWIAPIYNRTLADVTYAKGHQDLVADLIGAFNVSDVNRIEGNTQELYSLLVTYGYYSTLVSHAEWVQEDFMLESELDRIVANVQQIMDRYHSFGTLPSGFETLTFTDVNTIEEIIYKLKANIALMIESFRYSGTFSSGETYVF